MLLSSSSSSSVNTLVSFLTSFPKTPLILSCTIVLSTLFLLRKSFNSVTFTSLFPTFLTIISSLLAEVTFIASIPPTASSNLNPYWSNALFKSATDFCSACQKKSSILPIPLSKGSSEFRRTTGSFADSGN